MGLKDALEFTPQGSERAGCAGQREQRVCRVTGATGVKGGEGEEERARGETMRLPPRHFGVVGATDAGSAGDAPQSSPFLPAQPWERLGGPGSWSRVSKQADGIFGSGGFAGPQCLSWYWRFREGVASAALAGGWAVSRSARASVIPGLWDRPSSKQRPDGSLLNVDLFLFRVIGNIGRGEIQLSSEFVRAEGDDFVSERKPLGGCKGDLAPSVVPCLFLVPHS